MISICMAYFNRKKQLLKTLESINESSIKDYEVIIVDDGSSEEHKLDLNELKSRCNGNVILLEIVNKNWFNPCIAYNIAFSRASGDKIIIQNPETYHMGDLLKALDDRLKDGEYYTFHTIALNEAASEGLYARPNIASVTEYMQPILNSTHHLIPGENPYLGHIIWYNHKIYRPNHYHFISGITRNNLYALGGFDERYKDDHSWDDNEILVRIARLGLNKIFIENPIAIHLYHPMYFLASPLQGIQNNRLYHHTTLKERTIKFKDLDFNNYTQYLKEVVI